MKLFDTKENELHWLGVFYVAALPSTISIVMVEVMIAGGGIPSAIFNASISAFSIPL